MRVFLVDAGGTDHCVVVGGRLILVDDSDGFNAQWPARKVAEALAGVLGTKVEAMAWNPVNEAWTHADMLADVAAVAKQLEGKKK